MYNQVMSKSVFLDELAMAENSYLRSAPPAGTVEAPVVQRIAFQNVSFSYGEEANVLHDLTFSVDAGELVGVVGPSGAGKSTLVKLLLKLHDADTGRVLVNDVALTDVTRKSWSKRMAYVPQEPILMSASIEDNIRFLRPDISTEAVLRAARSASIHETIMAMPDGYATVLDDRGSDLSGGQRQRIAIARALVTGPDVLILDEPTSALDALSEAAIRETLGKLKGATTVFIIAHRMALLGECDRLVVLDNGRLEAFGAPAKLASVSPVFPPEPAAGAKRSPVGVTRLTGSAKRSSERPCQLPRKVALRRRAKERTPSAASSVAMRRRAAGMSASRAASKPASRARRLDSRVARTARGACSAMRSASSMARDSRVSGGVISCTRPVRRASCASISSPVRR